MSRPGTPFAQWLNATMQSRGLSQASVARQIGVADAQVSRWRRGQVTPSVRYLHRLATAFDVPRVRLEHMAGYPVEDAEAVDPALEAEIEGYQARFRRVMEEKVPPELWAAYTSACEALAERLSASFEDAASVEKRGPMGFRT